MEEATWPRPETHPATLTKHVREMAANLVLSRALTILEGACGMVVYRDADNRWNTDRFRLPGQPDRLEELSPVFEALLEWSLYTEKPVVVGDLTRSPWSRHLLQGTDPPGGSIAATPIAQRGVIWGAIAVYRVEAVSESIEVMRRLAEVATEPLSALGSGRPEGILPQA
jgi:GAF domain-containing protein